MANLTLLALGSSAPEILLAVMETLMTLGEPAGALGVSHYECFSIIVQKQETFCSFSKDVQIFMIIPSSNLLFETVNKTNASRCVFCFGMFGKK